MKSLLITNFHENIGFLVIEKRTTSWLTYIKQNILMVLVQITRYMYICIYMHIHNFISDWSLQRLLKFLFGFVGFSFTSMRRG